LIQARGTPIHQLGPDKSEATRVAIAQWAQQHTVNHAENRRCGADAERQREHGGERESRLTPEHAKGETEVLTNDVDHGVLLGLRGVRLRAPAFPPSVDDRIKQGSWAVKDFRNLIHPYKLRDTSTRPDASLAQALKRWELLGVFGAASVAFFRVRVSSFSALQTDAPRHSATGEIAEGFQ